MRRATDLIKQNMKVDVSLLLRFAMTKIQVAKMYAAMAMSILWMSLYISAGGVQSVEVSVCSGGELNLTCDASTPGETLLSWSLMIPGRFAPEIRFISSAGSAESAASTFTVGQTVFRFLRTSTSLLTSMIIINSVTSELNGTIVDCSSGGSTVSTTINIVNGNDIATSGCYNSTESPGIGHSSTADRNIIIAAVVSSIIVAAVCIIIGCSSCACGWFGHRFKKSPQARSDKNNSSQQPQPAPLYEEIQPRLLPEDQEKAASELKENIAYASIVHYTCNDRINA